MLSEIPVIPKSLISNVLIQNDLPLGLPDVSKYSIQILLENAEKHVKKAEEYARKGITDITTAKLILSKLKEINEFFLKAKQTESTIYQFKLVILYFIQEEDDESDFNSVIGFDDDADIVNQFIKTLNQSIKPIILS